jgi:prepilin-type N-terminal cleavage/methylation domain-containing protein
VKTRQSFTLIELLVVIAIILIIIGMLFPVLAKAKEAAKRVKAREMVTQLTAAWKLYYNDYRIFPAFATTGFIISNSCSNAMTILDGSCANVWSNRYLEFTTNDWVSGLHDPWFTQGSDPGNAHLYQISLDNGEGYDKTAYDGGVDVGTYPKVDKAVAVWSKGKDDKDSTPDEHNDDVRSWL